jgi:RHS repeat-associated protein
VVTMRARLMCAAFLLALALPIQAAEVFYLHTDHAGSVVMETDQQRNVTWQGQYEPYGLPTQTIPEGPGYTGHLHDAGSGLVYMQQRYYDPKVGRFLSVDPMAVDVGTAWNLNRYNYAANNPYRYTDPDGEAIHPILVGAAIGGGIGLVAEGASQYQKGEFNGRRLAVATGKGAVIGAAVAAASMVSAAFVATEGLTVTGAIMSEATMTYMAAFGTTLTVSPTADLLATGEMRPFEQVFDEAKVAGLGGGAGSVISSQLNSALIRAGTPSGLAATAATFSSEAVGLGINATMSGDAVPDKDELKFQ